MYIYIDIEKFELASVSEIELSEFFFEIARASMKGFHRIVVKRNLTLWAIKEVDMLQIHKAHLLEIAQEYAELGTPVNESTPSLTIKFGSEELTEVNDFKWTMGHRKFLGGNLLESATLLTESIQNDGEFYEFLFQMEAARIEFGPISLIKQAGGGSAITYSLSECARSGRIVICICDSDRVVPEGDYGDTFHLVEDHANELDFVGIASSTPGHEIENFIPIKIVKAMSNSLKPKGSVDDLIALFEGQGETTKEDCLYMFYDLKKGVDPNKLIKKCSEPSQKNWVERKYGNLIGTSGSNTLPKFGKGKNIIGSFLQDHELRKRFVEFLESDYWSIHFAPWTYQLLWFASGRKKMSVF